MRHATVFTCACSWALVALLAIVGSACGTARSTAWELPTANESVGSVDSASLEQAEVAWANRSNPDELANAVRIWSTAAAAEPTRAEFWLRLAEAHNYVATCVADNGVSRDASAVVQAHEAGLRAAERALVILAPEFAAAARQGGRTEESLDLVSVQAMPALYWRSAHLSAWALAKNMSTFIMYKDEAAAALTKQTQMAREIDERGADRTLAKIAARSPAYAGGDLDAAEVHYREALAGAPRYLLGKLAMAQEFATKRHDDLLRTRLLRDILASPNDIDPRFAPENSCAKRHAANIIAREEGREPVIESESFDAAPAELRSSEDVGVEVGDEAEISVDQPGAGGENFDDAPLE